MIPNSPHNLLPSHHHLTSLKMARLVNEYLVTSSPTSPLFPSLWPEKQSTMGVLQPLYCCFVLCDRTKTSYFCPLKLLNSTSGVITLAGEPISLDRQNIWKLLLKKCKDHGWGRESLHGNAGSQLPLRCALLSKCLERKVERRKRVTCISRNRGSLQNIFSY